MDHEKLKKYLTEEYGGYSLFEPEQYDEGIIGVTENGNVIYSYESLAEMLILHDDMTYEEAIEWLDYNTIRTIPYMGEFKPVILMDFPDCDDEWLVGASTEGAPIYSYDNIPEEPVKHECLEDYWLLDDDGTLPDPIIMYPLPQL
jgi:hypothetical protein